MLEDLPPFLTVSQAAQALQLGRSKVYELTVLYERTGGQRGLPFVRFGCQKRVPRAALVQFIENVLSPAADPAEHPAGATLDQRRTRSA
jgi:excisionase family DNA binding protein